MARQNTTGTGSITTATRSPTMMPRLDLYVHGDLYGNKFLSHSCRLKYFISVFQDIYMYNRYFAAATMGCVEAGAQV